MNLSYLMLYQCIINCITLILTIKYLRNESLKQETSNWMDYAIAFASLSGGEIGVLLALMIRKRKVNKSTMTPYSFAITALVFHCFILYLLFADKSQLNLIRSFISKYQHNGLIYCIAINAITFISFAYDKIAAIHHYRRLPNALLLMEAFCFGSLGALIAMGYFSHKTHKIYFTLTIPLMLMMQLMMLGLLING